MKRLVTYLYINGNFKDKQMVKTATNIRTEVFDVFDRSSDRLSRIQNYCNPFTGIHLNEEKDNIIESIPELSLSKVYVLIRHGDRGPLRPVRNQSSINCDPFLTSRPVVQSFIKRFFIETKDRLRHTLRDKSLHSMSNSNSLESGHLSRFGFVQHLTLGSFLGQLYRNKLNISSEYIKVYSTPYPRTYQSAVSFIYGFLKPKTTIDFKNFPQITTTFGTFFCFNREFCLKNCQKNEKLHKILNENKRQILSSHPAVVTLIDDLKSIIANNRSESQLFLSPVALFDGLMAYMCHNSGLPCDDQKCVTLEDVKQLISFIEFHGKQLSLSDEFKHLEWLKIYGFLNHLINRMNGTQSKHKLTLYSGHDITIVALTSALQLFDGVIPPYASRVIFETYVHKNKTNSNIFLRIIYNGKDMTRFTQICKTNPSKCLTFESKQIYLISLKDFKRYVLEKFKYFTQTNEYSKACNS